MCRPDERVVVVWKELRGWVREGWSEGTRETERDLGEGGDAGNGCGLCSSGVWRGVFAHLQRR